MKPDVFPLSNGCLPPRWCAQVLPTSDGTHFALAVSNGVVARTAPLTLHHMQLRQAWLSLCVDAWAAHHAGVGAPVADWLPDPAWTDEDEARHQAVEAAHRAKGDG